MKPSQKEVDDALRGLEAWNTPSGPKPDHLTQAMIDKLDNPQGMIQAMIDTNVYPVPRSRFHGWWKRIQGR